MTLDRPAPLAIDVFDDFPRNPPVMRFLTYHYLCDLRWRVKAGSCSSEPVRAPDGYSTTGNFEATEWCRRQPEAEHATVAEQRMAIEALRFWFHLEVAERFLKDLVRRREVRA